jgi:hypothetical protein
MFQIAGGSVGLGLNTTVFTSRSESSLDSHIAAAGANVTDSQSDLLHGILAGTSSARAVVTQFSVTVAHRLQALVRDAFVSGLHTAFRMDAALALCGLLVAVAFVGGVIRHQRLHGLGRWHHHSAPAAAATRKRDSI